MTTTPTEPANHAAPAANCCNACRHSIQAPHNMGDLAHCLMLGQIVDNNHHCHRWQTREQAQ